MSALSLLITEAETVLADATVAFGSGRLALHEHAAPPRVVAVETAGAYRDTDRPGGRLAGTTATRELYVRTLTVEWYCWGATEDAAESLMLELLRAMRRSDMLASMAPISYERVQQQQDEESWMTLGECYVLRVEHEVGVPEAVSPVAVAPMIASHTGTMTFPQAGGGTETGCAA